MNLVASMPVTLVLKIMEDFLIRWEGELENCWLLSSREKQVPSLVSYTRSTYWIFLSDVTGSAAGSCPIL